VVVAAPAAAAPAVPAVPAVVAPPAVAAAPATAAPAAYQTVSINGSSFSIAWFKASNFHFVIIVDDHLECLLKFGLNAPIIELIQTFL
jgi:hypothetical protein